nr:hypothetical protein [Ochrobactrum sp. CM-21-5]
MKHMGQQVYQLINDAIRVKGTLSEPFKPKDVRRVAPGWPYPRYFSFIAENCTDNQPDDTALFVRVGRGAYRLNDKDC